LVRRLERPEGALLISGLPAILRMGMALDWLRELAFGGELRSRTGGREGLGDGVAGGCNITRLYKEQRDALRALAMQVVVETADQQQIYYLVDLARREIRRRRHEPTVRALLADQDQARQFLATFMLERLDPRILTRDFQPLCIRQSDNGERLKLALKIDAD
jgi:hypothetical protein